MSVKYMRTKEIIFSDLGEDVVALHIPKGQCYGMENVTAAVWKMLDRPTDVEEIVRRLGVLYDVDEEVCRSDVTALADQMESEGLITKVLR